MPDGTGAEPALKRPDAKGSPCLKSIGGILGGFATLVLIVTIAAWSYLFNYLSFRFPWFRRFSAPGPLCLIRDGKRLRSNMRRQFITDDELDAMIRSHGIEHTADIKRAYLESDGQLSVITYSSDERR